MLSVKLSNSELNKLKSGIKIGTKVTLNFSSNLIRNFNNETNFPHSYQLIHKFIKLLEMLHQLI